MDKSQVHQAILAKDIIDMARDYASNPDIIEYIESLCWELFMVFGEQEQKVIEWDILSGAFEQLYIALQNGENAVKVSDEVNDIYSKASGIIEARYYKG